VRLTYPTAVHQTCQRSEAREFFGELHRPDEDWFTGIGNSVGNRLDRVAWQCEQRRRDVKRRAIVV